MTQRRYIVGMLERPHMSKMSIPALLLNRGILADAHMAIAARMMEKNKASPELAYLNDIIIFALCGFSMA